MRIAVASRSTLFLFLLFFGVLISAPELQAKGCMAGGCHQELTKLKYMHGPVAAEMAGVKACEMCHVSAGSKCSSKKGGIFKLKSKNLCQTCHVKGTGSQHSSAGVAKKCLKCHSPHGSDNNPQMLRAGLKPSKKKT